jgi:integrase
MQTSVGTEKLSRLTARRVETERRPGKHADGDGLYLLVKPGGAKSWVFRYQLNHRRRDMGLGDLDHCTLAQARRKASDARDLVAAGIDPIEHKQAQEAAEAAAATNTRTFADYAQEHIDTHTPGWRHPHTRADWISKLRRYVYPTIGDMPLRAIGVEHVLRVLKPLWSTMPVSAGTIRSHIEAVLDGARVAGYREGENPARWKGQLDAVLPAISKIHTVTHHPALPYTEIADFMEELRERSSIGARALELTILTGLRKSEVNAARWDEIDLAERVWTIPAARMKMSRTHRVPLSAPAIAVLEQMQAVRHNEYVFPGMTPGRPIDKATTWSILQRLGRTNITVHGFRSAFRSWAADNDVSDSLAEAVLAHQSDKVVRAYQRSDLFERRRQLMEVWAQFCIGAPADEKVVPLRRAADRNRL